MIRVQLLVMQSCMKNQRSSPTRPLLFRSARPAYIFGLLARHCAFISFNIASVSLYRDVLALSDDVVAAGGMACAIATESKHATNAKATRHTLIRNMLI